MTALSSTAPATSRSLKGPTLCAVGSGTAERAGAQYGIKVDLIPDEFRAEAVVAAMPRDGHVEGASVLVPRADIGRDVIAEQLRERRCRRHRRRRLPHRARGRAARTASPTSIACCSTAASTS